MTNTLRAFNRLAIPVFIITLSILHIAEPVLAQTDSLNFVHTQWENTKVAPGVVLKHYLFKHTLFESNQNINILEVKMNRKNKLDVAAETKTLEPTSEFGIKHEALAAINGTFFDMKNGGSVDYIRVDGKPLNVTRVNANGKRGFHQQSAVVINKGKLSIQELNGADDWETSLLGEDIMTTGPLLLKDGRRNPLDSIAFNTARHPRTAIAVKGKKVFLITVDGRNERSAGMNLFELASIIKWLKADDGINLDGGGSTTMWIKGFPDGGVVNHPSDNKAMLNSAQHQPGTDLDNLAADEKKWDHTGERPVANVILVSRRK